MKRCLEILAVVLVVAVLILLLQPVVQQPHPEREARHHWRQQLKAIESGESTKIVMPDFQISRHLLPDLKPVAERITELNLSGDGLAEEWKAIIDCPHLKILHMRTKVGDAELRTLVNLKELEVLDLPLATEVTDAGLKSLAGHPTLKLVRLRAPQVTDAGLEAFCELPALRWLHLMEVPVTDKGLSVFRDLTKLESLYLDGDHASDEGLSSLVLARPDLHFHRDQLHLTVDPRQQDGHAD